MKPLFIGLLVLLILPGRLPAYDPEVWTSYPSMNYVTSLAEGDTRIYVATTGGIRRYDRFGNRWLSPLTTLDGLPDNRVERLAYDPHTGDLWFDTPAGPARWISRLERVSLAGQNPGLPHRSRPAIPGVYAPFGYFLEERLVRGPRRDYAVTDVLIDTWRILWTGTWGLGVGRADLRDEQLEFHRFGPLDENVTAIARDGEAVWFGGEDTYQAPARGLTRYSPASDTWEYFEADQIIGLDNAQVSTILPDSADVWFGTRSGLMRYTKKGGRWATYRVSRRRTRPVTALARDQGKLWIGTESGLAVLDLKADTIRTVAGSEHFTIRALAAGPDHIWAGTDFGLYRCPRREVTWSPAQQGKEGLTKGAISALSIRGNDVWATVETPPGLIHRQGSEETWRRYPLSEVSGSRRVAIAADTGRVWVATDLGAFRLDVARQLWKPFTRFDGLLHNRVQTVFLDGEYVWFGTEGGISRFHWAADFFESDR